MPIQKMPRIKKQKAYCIKPKAYCLLPFFQKMPKNVFVQLHLLLSGAHKCQELKKAKCGW